MVKQLLTYLNDYTNEFKGTLVVGLNAVGVGITTLLAGLSNRYLDLDDVFKGIIILGLAVLFELITGLRALYLHIKSGKKEIDETRSITHQVGVSEVINKTIAYTTALVLAALISDWLGNPTYTFLGIFPNMSIVSIIVMIGVTVELIQIYFNFRAMGIDLGKTIKDFAKEAWSVFNSVKNNKNENVQ